MAGAARYFSRGWLAPGPFAVLIWSAFVWISMLSTDYPVYASAVWVVVLLVFSLQMGSFVTETVMGGKPNRQPRHSDVERKPTSRRLVGLSVAFSSIALLGAVYFISWTFTRFDLAPSLISFLGLGHLWSVQRYDYGELEPWAVRLTTMWVYPAALIGGIACARSNDRKTKFYCLLPFIPALLVGTIVAERAGVLITVIIWVSGYLGVKYSLSNETYTIFRGRPVLVLTMLGIAGVALFLLIDAIRQSNDGQTFNLILDSQRFFKYAFGSLAAFSHWWHESASPEAGFGAYTFGGIFDVLGIKHREIGLYEGMITLPGGEETNIYTAIRGLIQDFTLVGALLLTFAVGLVSGALLSSSSRASTRVLFASGFYAFILCSPLTSIFTYNGVVLAWLVGAIVLRFELRAAVDEIAGSSRMGFPTLQGRCQGP